MALYKNTDGQRIIKQKLSEQVADQLEQLILNGYYKEDEKLPSELELTQEFEVSRNVIREALNVLKERGLVNIKNGLGAFVTRPQADNITSSIERMIVIDNIDYRQIYFVRILLETANCSEAALRITPEELDNLENIYHKLTSKKLTLSERRKMDYSFHIAIAKASGNKLLLLFTESMKTVCEDAMFLPEDVQARNSIDEAIAFHRKILDALKNHDPEAASGWMRKHLEKSVKNISLTMNSSSAFKEIPENNVTMQ